MIPASIKSMVASLPAFRWRADGLDSDARECLSALCELDDNYMIEMQHGPRPTWHMHFQFASPYGDGVGVFQVTFTIDPFDGKDVLGLTPGGPFDSFKHLHSMIVVHGVLVLLRSLERFDFASTKEISGGFNMYVIFHRLVTSAHSVARTLKDRNLSLRIAFFAAKVAVQHTFPNRAVYVNRLAEHVEASGEFLAAAVMYAGAMVAADAPACGKLANNAALAFVRAEMFKQAEQYYVHHIRYARLSGTAKWNNVVSMYTRAGELEMAGMLQFMWRRDEVHALPPCDTPAQFREAVRRAIGRRLWETNICAHKSSPKQAAIDFLDERYRGRARVQSSNPATPTTPATPDVTLQTTPRVASQAAKKPTIEAEAEREALRKSRAEQSRLAPKPEAPLKSPGPSHKEPKSRKKPSPKEPIAAAKRAADKEERLRCKAEHEAELKAAEEQRVAEIAARMEKLAIARAIAQGD